MPSFRSSLLGKLHTVHRPFSLYHPPIVDVAWRLVNDLVVCVERTVRPEDHAYGQLGCRWYGHGVLHTALFTVKYCLPAIYTSIPFLIDCKVKPDRHQRLVHELIKSVHCCFFMLFGNLGAAFGLPHL